MLYLRFDKQEAYLGNLKMGQSDSIHVKIKLQGRALDVDEMGQLLGLFKDY
jgi:RNA binding exosome subunit